MDWINEHMEDPDFNEELLIVKKEGEGDIKQQYQGNLCKEERIKMAEEKIKANRAIREAEEKKNRHEQEKNRIVDTKEAQKAQRLWADQEA